MPHWQQCAIEDAEVRSRPLGITKFIDCKTGICRLCGHGLGKRFTRDWRKFHEGDNQHRLAYSRYTNEFDRLFDLRFEAVQEAARQKQIEEHREWIAARRDIAHEALGATGLTHWIRRDDNETRRVKAALFDMLLDDGTSDAALEVARRHLAAERRRLVYLAAASVLPDDAAGAWTAARLCALYI